jgi:hypothetical protein
MAEAQPFQTVFPGHFLAASSEDAPVNGVRCESHAQGMSGSFLFTRDRDSWRKVRSASGTRAGDCRKLPGSGGRHRLGNIFFGLIDNTNAGACHAYRDDDDAGGEGVLTAASIDQVEFTDLPAKCHVRIVVIANEGSVRIPSKLREQICAGDAPEPDVTNTIKPTRYEFTFDGAKVQ